MPSEPKKCLLCHKPPTLVGVFVPNEPHLYGGKSGTSRGIVYGTCKTHTPKTDADVARIEALLERWLINN